MTPELPSPVATFALAYCACHVVWTATFAVLHHAHRRLAAAAGGGSGDGGGSPRPPLPPPRWAAALAPFTEDDFTRRRTGNYVLSALHATITSSVGVFLCWHNGVVTAGTRAAFSASHEELLRGGIPAAAPLAVARTLLSGSLAYFVHDLVSTMPDWDRNPSDIFHHLAGAVLTASPLLSASATVLGHTILVSEASTPFLNAMWFLRKLRAQQGAAYRAAAYTFVGVFFVSRLLFLNASTALALYHLGGPLSAAAPHVLPLMVCLCALNAWWWRKIVAMMRRGSADEVPATHLSEQEWRQARHGRQPPQPQQLQPGGAGAVAAKPSGGAQDGEHGSGNAAQPQHRAPSAGGGARRRRGPGTDAGT